MKQNKSMRRNKNDRGNAMVLTIIVLMVLTIMGMGLITSSTLDIQASGAHRGTTVLESCIEGARQMLVSRFQFGANIPDVKFDKLAVGGGFSVSTAHYDYSVTNAGCQPTKVDMAQGSSPFLERNRANRIIRPKGGGGAFRCIVLCADSLGRQLELEFLVNWIF